MASSTVPHQLQALPEDWQRALIIVAHPDDTEYGAAAAVARWTRQGKEVAYLMVSRGEAGIAGLPPEECAVIREAEQRASAAIVGVDVVEFLDHADGLITYGPELRHDLAAAIRRHRPELVLSFAPALQWAPGAWNHPDHRAVALATFDAIGDAGNEWLFRDLLDEGLQPWGGVRYGVAAGSPTPTHAVDVTGFVDVAVDSLAAHDKYLEVLDPDTPPEVQARNHLEMVLHARSSQFGDVPCVALELLVAR